MTHEFSQCTDMQYALDINISSLKLGFYTSNTKLSRDYYFTLRYKQVFHPQTRSFQCLHAASF